VIHKGARLRASQPVVQACPQYFGPDGLSDAEYNQRLVAVGGQVTANT
jgi:hypothetical protein